MTKDEIWQFITDVVEAADKNEYEKLFDLLNKHFDDVPVGSKLVCMDVVAIIPENIKSMRVIINSGWIPKTLKYAMRYNAMLAGLVLWCNERL